MSTATSLAQAREELARQEPDVLLIDLQLPDGSGLELLQRPRAGCLPASSSSPATPASTSRSRRCASGPADFLTKPVDFARVKMALANLARTRELSREIGALRGELRRLGRFGPLIGASARMQKVYDLIAQGRAHGRHGASSSARPAPARSSWPRPSTR